MLVRQVREANEVPPDVAVERERRKKQKVEAEAAAANAAAAAAVAAAASVPARQVVAAVAPPPRPVVVRPTYAPSARAIAERAPGFVVTARSPSEMDGQFVRTTEEAPAPEPDAAADRAARKGRTVFIGNLPPGTSPAILAAALGPTVGPVTYVRVRASPRESGTPATYAFVEFAADAPTVPPFVLGGQHVRVHPANSALAKATPLVADGGAEDRRAIRSSLAILDASFGATKGEKRKR
jgi:hypothetical protein